ncbi:MAG: flagellar motor switch protein FliN [Buchnera aphidicola (Kaburagia rhusicola ensigallis)]
MNDIKNVVENKDGDSIDKFKTNLDKKKIKKDNETIPSKKFMQESNNINFVVDIPVNVTVELGNIKLKVRDILNLNKDSILTLDKYSGEPLNILANQFIIAKGELVIVEEKYGIRITDIIDTSNSLNSAN